MRRDYSRMLSSYNTPHNAHSRAGLNMDVFLFIVLLLIVMRSPAIVEWVCRLLGW